MLGVPGTLEPGMWEEAWLGLCIPALHLAACTWGSRAAPLGLSSLPQGERDKNNIPLQKA